MRDGRALQAGTSHLVTNFAAAFGITYTSESGTAELCHTTSWGMSTRMVGLASAGEPLNPEVIDQVEKSWGLTIRDGYGQTESTAMIGNSPGQRVKTGSMGRPLPGYRIALADLNDQDCTEGEVAVRLEPRPTGLMVGYTDDPDRTEAAMQHRLYHTLKRSGCCSIIASVCSPKWATMRSAFFRRYP